MNFYLIFLYIIRILSFVGIFIILVFISNIIIDKKLKEVNNLISEISENNTHHRCMPSSYYLIKRSYDILISLTGLVILLPIIITTAILIKIESGGPIFIRKKRVGRYGVIFNAYEFSTKKNYIGKDLGKEQYTKVGLFLYRTSIYELPKFINVLKGDMSIIGISQYNEDFYNCLSEKVRNEISYEKPGIVSLWALSLDKQEFRFTKKYFFDLYYVSNMSLWLDICIALKTFILAFAITGDF